MKIFRILPVILYPYVDLICLTGLFIAFSKSGNHETTLFVSLISLLAIGIICNIYSLVMAFMLLHSARKRRISALELAKINMIIKLAQIPSYIIHFCMAIIGMLMSVWGIPLIIWAALIDFLTIIVSGIINVSANISCVNEERISSGTAVVLSILGFIYCIDVVISVVLFIQSRKSREVLSA